MEAAAHGHSTLGIPKKVGRDVLAADKGKRELEHAKRLGKRLAGK